MYFYLNMIQYPISFLILIFHHLFLHDNPNVSMYHPTVNIYNIFKQKETLQNSAYINLQQIELFLYQSSPTKNFPAKIAIFVTKMAKFLQNYERISNCGQVDTADVRVKQLLYSRSDNHRHFNGKINKKYVKITQITIKSTNFQRR